MASNSNIPDIADAPPRPNRPTRRWPAICTKLAMLVFCTVCALEGVSRVYGTLSNDVMLQTTLRDYSRLANRDFGHFRFVPDEHLPYRLKPGFETRSEEGRVLTHHNALGFRGDFDGAPKQPGTLRVVCLGGSTTYGVSVEDNNATYPAALERFLNSESLHDGWERAEVFNLGVGGYTILEVLKNLRIHGLPLQPDVVLIQSAINDVAPRFYRGFRCDYTHFRKRMAPLDPNWLERLLYRSQFLIVAGYKVGRFGPLTLQAQVQQPWPTAETAERAFEANGTDCFQTHLTDAAALALDAGAKVYLLTQPYLNAPAFEAHTDEMRRLDALYRKGLAQHNDVVRKTALVLHVPCIDLDQTMPMEARYFADPIHMTELGNNVKGRLIAEAMLASF